MRAPVSFIVPVFNYASVLAESVESICRGNLQPNDEIMIVNDASTDNSNEVIAALASRIPQVRVISHKYNKGCGNAGVNTAIESAKHDIFLRLDPDNLLAPDSVDGIITFMVEKGADVAAFEEVRFFDGDPDNPTHSWFFKPHTTLADALSGFRWPGPDGNYFFTRNSWLRAGRCDEFSGLDTWVFGIQQLATGSKMMALPGSHYLHRWGHESLFVREERDGNLSFKALRGLLPILHLLEKESVDYIFSEEGRSTWFRNLDKRPLRVMGQSARSDGRLVRHARKKDPLQTRI